MAELPPRYDPRATEETRYAWWEARGLFRADPAPRRTPYTIVIPPPNVTGILHMGHALNNTIQDILIRAKRMQGFNALWVPGTDHAGIATQNVVEKALAQEGKRRQDLGREAFVARAWAWKEQYGNTIIRQLRRLGASCDWRRTRFTMDEGLSEAVAEVFVRLYRDGLIYRGTYITNWCPRCQTALADEEAPRKEVAGKLYHMRYPLEGQGAGDRGQGKTDSPAPRPVPLAPRQYIEVATTRPETMLGDTAIAVHPKDRRYAALIGQAAILPLVNRRLPIIADPIVDKDFGTGAVKVTPAHDPVDFRLGKAHKLEAINVMTDDARMTNVPRAYEGLDRYACRSKLIVDLEQAGYLGAIEEHRHAVGHCYRCQTVVEPRLSPQWFVRMKPLAQPAIAAVRRGVIRFSPPRWTKVYLNWMTHIEDWCISRQIWWGHRLPVWYCQPCTNRQPAAQEARKRRGVVVAKARPACCPDCGSDQLTQDEDVLDTWFSSWLWPCSTLGWPKQTKDLASFYPTSTLVTAPEIIFFWVARMIMAGYYCMRQPPFRRVVIHGTVRDLTGRKMSKSLGNIIDPLEVIEEYGTDALRFTLVTTTATGGDLYLSEERFVAGRNFANKLWNATRYVLAYEGARGRRQGAEKVRLPRPPPPAPRPVSLADRWILSRLQTTIRTTTAALENFMFNEATGAVYDFLWHDFCDWYVELSKQVPPAQRAATSTVLIHVLEMALRLLHPVMPFVTEELWQRLKREEKSTSPARRPAPQAPSIMTAAWPKPQARLIDAAAERQFARLRALILAIRATRAELHVPVDRLPPIVASVRQPAARRFVQAHAPVIRAMARVREVNVQPAIAKRPKHAAAMVVNGIELFMPLEGIIDLAVERKRLEQRRQELQGELSRLEARLHDPQFLHKAPKDVVDQARTRHAEAKDTLKRCSAHLAVL